MFDRYEVVPRYPQRIDSHEHRAPTDDSIRLAREYEDRAWESVKSALLVSGNSLEGIIIQRAYNPAAFDSVWLVIFRLNGKPFEFQIENDRRAEFDARKAIEAFAQKLAQVIASEIINVGLDCRQLPGLKP